MAEVEGLEVQVSANTAEFNKNIKSLNRQLRMAGSDAKVLKDELKFKGVSIERLDNAIAQVQKQLQLTKQKQSELNAEMRRMEAAGNVDTSKYEGLYKKLNSAESSAMQLENQLEQLNQQRIDLQTQQAQSSLQRLSQKAQEVGQKLSAAGSKIRSVGSSISGIGSSLMPVTGAIAGIGGASIKLASDLDESMNKVNVAFGDSASEVTKFADTSLKQFGIARGTALDMSATFGDMGTSMGLSQQEASKMSTSLVGLAGDLSSFKNIGIDEATTALQGVFTGETESLKRLGIVMTDTNVKAFAMSNGFKGNWESASQSEKVMYRYKYVLDATKNAQGDFARTGGGAANQMRMFGENIKQLGENFGKTLLPTFNKIVTALNGLLEKFQQMTPAQQQMIAQVGLVVAAIGPLTMVVGKVVSGFGMLMQFGGFLSGTVFPALATAIGGLSAPVLAVVAVVGSIIAVFAAAYMKIESFRNAMNQLMSVLMYGVKTAFEALGQFIKAIFTPVIEACKNVWDNSLRPAFERAAAVLQSTVIPAIRSMVDWFKAHVVPIAIKVGSIVGDVLGGVFTALGNILGGLINVVADVVEWFGKMWNKFTESTVGQKVIEVFKKIGKWINDALDSVKSFTSGFSNMVQSVSNWVGNLVENVSEGFSKVGKWIDKINPLSAGGFGADFNMVEAYEVAAGGYGVAASGWSPNFYTTVTVNGQASQNDIESTMDSLLDEFDKRLYEKSRRRRYG